LKRRRMNDQDCPWKQINFGLILICIAGVFHYAAAADSGWYLPIKIRNRQSLGKLTLTRLGIYGLVRKPRPGVPSHLHTGIDIKRPSDNYANEPVYPASRGVVISVRDDGPFAQIIIEHVLKDSVRIWTVYEHVSGIMSAPGDTVLPLKPLCRFMNKNELDRFGWQFDHVHFEVLKKPPESLQPDHRNPLRFYNSYGLGCYTRQELNAVYFDPVKFLKHAWLAR
jgi:hypothetical protein